MSSNVEMPEASPEQFPALRRLGWRSRRQVPFVQQLEAADCGAACLSMVLSYFGKTVRLDEVREAVGVSVAGSDALSVVRAAEWFGLRGRGLRCEVEDLHFLRPGAILHWEFNHFVVFEHIDRRGARIVDPGFGRRIVPLDQLRESFTGVALTFETTDAFETSGRTRTKLWTYLRHLLAQRPLVARVMVASVLLRVFALGLPVLTALVVDRVVPRSDENLLLVVCVGLGGVLVFQFLSELIRAHLLLQLRTNLDTRMTLGFLDHLVSLPYDFFQRRSTGDLMMRVSSNTHIREQLTANTLSALLDGVLVLVYLALILALSPVMGAVVSGLGLIQVVVFLASRRRYRELMSQDLESQARAQAYLVQMIAGIQSLKVAGAEGRAVEHWSNLFVDELNVALDRGRLAAFVESLKRGVAGWLTAHRFGGGRGAGDATEPVAWDDARAQRAGDWLSVANLDAGGECAAAAVALELHRSHR